VRVFLQEQEKKKPSKYIATEKKENNKVWLHKMNNGTIGLILAITVINIFISAFGIESTN
jgi:hypothetical protein